MVYAHLLLVMAGGVPSFEGGYIEEEKRRSIYLDVEVADSTYSPVGGDIDTTLFSVAAGYSRSFRGRRAGSCPAAFIDIAGQCSNIRAGLLVHSTEMKSTAGDASSDLTMLVAGYTHRSPDGFAFFAEGGLGLLDNGPSDTQFQLGVGAGSGNGSISEVSLIYYLVDFDKKTTDPYTVLVISGVYLWQPASENWVLFGTRWKQVEVDGPGAPDTDTLSLSADWYFVREAYVGIELSLATSSADQPYYLAPPAGVLGEHIGYRIGGGYERRDLRVSAWVEPRTRKDSTELAWGLSGAYKF